LSIAISACAPAELSGVRRGARSVNRSLGGLANWLAGHKPRFPAVLEIGNRKWKWKSAPFSLIEVMLVCCVGCRSSSVALMGVFRQHATRLPCHAFTLDGRAEGGPRRVDLLAGEFARAAASAGVSNSLVEVQNGNVPVNSMSPPI